ncbi:hypothetical protein [Nocardia sp. NPDC004750]
MKIASMVDEPTREPLLHLVEHSITGEKLVAELARVFVTRGVPKVLRCDNDPEMISTALQRFAPTGSGLPTFRPARIRERRAQSRFERLRHEILLRNSWRSTACLQQRMRRVRRGWHRFVRCTSRTSASSK